MSDKEDKETITKPSYTSRTIYYTEMNVYSTVLLSKELVESSKRTDEETELKGGGRTRTFLDAKHVCLTHKHTKGPILPNLGRLFNP